jgi:coenzyme F420 hydrogenase subunit beta
VTHFGIDKVVGEGLCVGCGACRVAAGRAIDIKLNPLGYYVADLSQAGAEDIAIADKVCPFSDAAADETAIGRQLFAGHLPDHDAGLGHHLSVYSGSLLDVGSRLASSSGGLTSWLTIQLFEQGLIDGVVHVADRAAEGGDGRLFDYCISETRAELDRRKKSQYYACEFSGVLESVRGNGRTYAIVGTPCFVKAARLLARQDSVLGRQLKYFVGLVCGHLKSSAFAELLAWQVGVPPAQLAQVDFRLKVEGQIASAYAFGARKSGSEDWQARGTGELFGGNWGHALFQLQACDYCDDIFAETADVCFGDAWLPQFEADWRGTNVVICRSREIDAILRHGREASEIVLEPLSVAAAIESQAGNFRHRWDGLSVRLADRLRRGKPVPAKRIKPGSRRVSFLRRGIVRARQRMAAHSHIAFAAAKARGDLDAFFHTMQPLLRRMNRYQLGLRLVNGVLRRLLPARR